ncbi:MAG: DNA polymerase III subunit epsilon, partial [Ignavibacteriales bacterium]|nr:DNA polymerase III subunit epsilon [Ignavibacteriales bacterium]
MDFENVLHRPINHALFAVLDVETTGLVAKRDRVIEVAVALMKDGVVEDRFESFVNPGRKVPGEITKLTGIADEDVEHAPYFEEIASELVRYLDDAVFVAHNAPFDLKFLRAEFARAGVEPPPQPRLCTLRLAKR